MGAVFIDLFCILILGVILLGIFLQRNPGDKVAFRFTVLVLVAELLFVSYLFSDYIEGKASMTVLSYVVNTVVFIAVDGVLIAFARYIDALVKNRGKRITKHINLVIAVCLMRMVLVIVLTVTGNMFTIENGVYTEQSLCIIPYFITALEMLMMLFIIFGNRKLLSKREFTVTIIYLLFPVIPVVVEVFTNMYSLTPMSMTLAILLVYALIQAVALEEGRAREDVLEEISSTDLLTNLNNRRAYYNYISNITDEQNIGVIFCDINGLKYTNDHFGHSTGDALIKNFADLLSRSFRAEEIFRISGDEFVVLMLDISEELFAERFDKFVKLVGENNSIAASGSAFGKGCRIDGLIAEAEEKMYEAKKNYYKESKSDRGRHRE